MFTFTSPLFVSYLYWMWPNSSTTIMFPSEHCSWESLWTSKYKIHLCSTFCNMHWTNPALCSSNSLRYKMPSCLHRPRTFTSPHMTSLTTSVVHGHLVLTAICFLLFHIALFCVFSINILDLMLSTDAGLSITNSIGCIYCWRWCGWLWIKQLLGHL